MECKLQEESSYQLNLFCLFFQAFFLVYALGCLSIYYGEVRVSLDMFWSEIFTYYGSILRC